MHRKIIILHPRGAVGQALTMCLHYSNFEDIAAFQTLAELLGAVHENCIYLIDTQFIVPFVSELRGDIVFSILVTMDSDPNIVEALYAGAASFINISKGPAHFVNHVELLVANKTDEPSQLIRNFFTERKCFLHVLENGDYNLTNKEAAILKMMREGKHLKLIAQYTGTSYETVRTHAKHIYKKLRVMSASEAVIKAMKMKL